MVDILKKGVWSDGLVTNVRCRFLWNYGKPKKCQRTLDTNKSPTNLDFLSKFSYDIERNVAQERSTQVALTEKEIHWL